jgi:hypothetical protein
LALDFLLGLFLSDVVIDVVFEGEAVGFLVVFDHVMVEVALIVELEGVSDEVFAHFRAEDGLHDHLDVPSLDAAQFDEPTQTYPVVLYLVHI